VRLFLEAIHAEYAMGGSAEPFVRTFRRYSLEDLRDAERRFHAHACRCKVRVCDRYFAAVVRRQRRTCAFRRQDVGLYDTRVSGPAPLVQRGWERAGTPLWIEAPDQTLSKLLPR
jgi:hypothetical protein